MQLYANDPTQQPRVCINYSDSMLSETWDIMVIPKQTDCTWEEWEHKEAEERHHHHHPHHPHPHCTASCPMLNLALFLLWFGNEGIWQRADWPAGEWFLLESRHVEASTGNGEAGG